MRELGRMRLVFQLLCLVWFCVALHTEATQAPSRSPTRNPTVALNTADQNAFLQLSTNLNRAAWRDCNREGDPCTVCRNNSLDAAVECEVVSVSGHLERRIVGLRFRNLGIKGTIDQFVLFAFTALREVDLSSDFSRAWGNRILPVFGKACVDVSLCYANGVSCNFGVVAPVCDLLTPTTAPTTTPAPIGMYIGIAFGVVGALAIASIGLLIWSQRRSKKRAREEKKRAKERKRRKMMEQQREDDMHSVFSRETAASSNASLSSRPSRAKSEKRKSFTSLRTRAQKKGSAANQQSAAPVGWVQQIDPMTGTPFWLNPVTGVATRDPPPMALSTDVRSLGPRSAESGQSSRKLMRQGSKKLTKKGSSKTLSKSGSMIIKKRTIRFPWCTSCRPRPTRLDRTAPQFAGTVGGDLRQRHGFHLLGEHCDGAVFLDQASLRTELFYENSEMNVTKSGSC